MYVSKGIYIESVALVKYIKGTPVLLHHGSKTGYQVHATENRLDWNNLYALGSSRYHFRDFIHEMFGFWKGQERCKPLDIGKVGWRHRIS